MTENTIWSPTDRNGKQTHGGVIVDNVTFDKDGNLVLIANGDRYVGNKQGVVDVSEENLLVSGGQRTGAKVQSVNTYGPGSFQAVMKIPSFNGICTSMWLFNNFKDGNIVRNYEVDIEIHGTAVDSDGNLLGMDNGNVNCGNVFTPLFTAWITESDYTSEYKNVGYSLADGKFHAFRIDWHTGDDPRVEYYVDNVLMCVQRTNVPDNEMYINIGCWFPRNWCGQPDFETDCAVVKSFTYTPFANETANKNHCSQLQNGGFSSEVEVPTVNLIANGEFDYELNKNDAWTVTDGAAWEKGSLTFDGTLSQTVTMDCWGNSYDLTVNGAGNGNVKITYGSIVNGVEVTGTASGAVGETITLVPPANCTRMIIEITSAGSLTLNSVTLTYANA